MKLNSTIRAHLSRFLRSQYAAKWKRAAPNISPADIFQGVYGFRPTRKGVWRHLLVEFKAAHPNVEIILPAEVKAAKLARRQAQRAAQQAKKRDRVTASKRFYRSPEWRALRFDALKAANGKCSLCGRGAAQDVILHVDHIKPRSKHPALELVRSNLQVLCEDCNLGKSNRDDTDWRCVS